MKNLILWFSLRRLFSYWVSLLFFFFLSIPGAFATAPNDGRTALVMKALSNPFFSSMEQGAKEYAQENSIPLDIFGINRETDADQQIAILENLIAQDYAAIVVAPVDAKSLIPVCKKALEKGILVINIDNPLHQPTLKEQNLFIPFVGSDNRAGGAMVGQYIRDKLNNRGRVFILEGTPGAGNADLRQQGFYERLTKDSGIEVVASESANGHTDEAFSLTMRLLDQYGEVDAILCANDEMALGALQALEQQGLAGEVLIGGYDNIAAVRAAMRSGRIHATIEQHPELIGEYGVRLAQQGLAGGSLPEIFPVPLDLVTYESFVLTLGMSISNLDNPFFKVLLDGAQGAAAVQGITLLAVDAENRDAKQLSDIFAFIEKGVSAIIINPTSTDMIVPGIELANRQNIPVFIVDRKVSGGGIISLVASDNLAGGKLAAEILVKHLGGMGRVVELEGIPGASATVDRGTGFNDALLVYPDIQVVAREAAQFERAPAKRVILKLLSQGTEFDAVFAHNDNMILGALEALTESGLRDKILIGFDGIPEAKDAVAKGRIAATIAQVPDEMGAIVVGKAVAYLRGEAIPGIVSVRLEAIERED
jgi:ABC-type sugar transport system substrate-binding protein